MRDAAFVRISKLSLIRISFTGVCQNQLCLVLTNTSKGNSDNGQDSDGDAAFVRIALTVICPNRFLEYCHLSESILGILSLV